MNWRQRIFLILVLLPFAGVALDPAHAQSRVGEAVLVQNEVARVAGTLSMPINVGDGLMRDETVRTGQESAAKLVMADNTNLSLGPNATITLDRTVFNDEHSYRDIAIKLATGAFRFVTGNSEKAAYKITTSVATIGVRGTVLDILSQRGKNHRGVARRRFARLRHRRCLHGTDKSRRHRHHHLDRQQDHDPEVRQLALDLRGKLRGIARALQRNAIR
jgi:hypothetical protein